MLPRRPTPQKPTLSNAPGRQGPRAVGMSKAGAVPPVVGPAHLVARHQERQIADSSARSCPAGLPLCHLHQTLALNLANVIEVTHTQCIDNNCSNHNVLVQQCQALYQSRECRRYCQLPVSERHTPYLLQFRLGCHGLPLLCWPSGWCWLCKQD